MITQKYFKKSNGMVYAFDIFNGDDNYLNYVTSDMQEMTTEEIDKHLNPQDYLTDEQKYQHYLNSLPSLTRRQFKLVLLQNGLLDTVEQAIAQIDEPLQRQTIQIEYAESTAFERSSPSVLAMVGLLNLTEQQVNEMWEAAMLL